MATGSFYVVATPLGNLEDVSQRLQSTLANCDLIAAEDTRVARRLLSALGIKGKKIISVRAQNENALAPKLVKLAQQGTVAYLTDAGTPCISDPGAKLTAAMHDAKIAVVPIAGPSAVTTALSVAGFAADAFVFGGFLPRAKVRAREKLRQLSSVTLPLVLFESPKRISSTLELLAEVLPKQTRICLCAELTKLHEHVTVSTLAQAIEQIADTTLRGEYTLVVEVPQQDKAVQLEPVMLAQELATQLPPRQAAKLAAKLTGANVKELYNSLKQN